MAVRQEDLALEAYVNFANLNILKMVISSGMCVCVCMCICVHACIFVCTFTRGERDGSHLGRVYCMCI